MRLAQFLAVVIMVSLFSKAFGMASASSLPPLGATRTINFDGSKLTFSMPENFSKEFPAEPIVEQVSLDDVGQSRLLAQRWWDIDRGYAQKYECKTDCIRDGQSHS